MDDAKRITKSLRRIVEAEEAREKRRKVDESEDIGHPKHTEDTLQTLSKEWIHREFAEMAPKVTDAMASYLEEGQILLRDYEIKDYLIERDVTGRKMKAGSDPVIHGLVTGRWGGEDVLVFVGPSFSLSAVEECRRTIFEVTTCLHYWELLVKLGKQYVDDDGASPYMTENFYKMEVEKHGKRKAMVALAAEGFEDAFPRIAKSWKPKAWFRIQRRVQALPGSSSAGSSEFVVSMIDED